jgi:hypothetical protein
MITPRQNAFYWSLWSQAKRELMKGRETWTGDEENRRRHELHIRAIGRDKSHKDFTNRDLDLVLAEFKIVIDPSRERQSRVNAQEMQRRGSTSACAA